jgi:hypothetical protein
MPFITCVWHWTRSSPRHETNGGTGLTPAAWQFLDTLSNLGVVELFVNEG